MKKLQEIQNLLGRTDVYLLDQIMKGRYDSSDIVLDAGCGHGRNASLLLKSGIKVMGIDSDPEKIEYCKTLFPEFAIHFSTQDLTSIQFEDDFFDHIISSAVLHFATSKQHYLKMLTEHIRVLKPGGSLFIRSCTLFGISEGTAAHLKDGVYQLPNYPDQFLLTYPLINELLKTYNLCLLEPIKTVHVSDQRAMGVIVFGKK